MTQSEQSLESYIQILKNALKTSTFLGLRLTQRWSKDSEDDLRLVFIKLVQLKRGPFLSFVYRYPTKDITKNHSLDESPEIIEELLKTTFTQSELNTQDLNYYLTLFKGGRVKLRQKVNDHVFHVSKSHDHEKNRMIKSEDNIYLRELGITTKEFRVKDKMQDKYRQINKYVEIIDDILKKTKVPEDVHIVDMGSGKGYLTFALYDYFTNLRSYKPQIAGVEIRKDLVEKCNNIANLTEYSDLKFIEGSIQKIEFNRIDFLLALHACDTATDDAIWKGIQTSAKLIVCAPCCHKQLRKQMKTEGPLQHLTKHGIMKERQAEILTDTIRSLFLEAYGYRTRVFEFISTSHTPKNVLIVATREFVPKLPDPVKIGEIQAIKDIYGIRYQHLEKLAGIYQPEY